MINRNLAIFLVLCAIVSACGNEQRDPKTVEDLWPQSPDTNDVEEPIAFTDQAYSFPLEEEPGISLLTAQFPISRDSAWIKLSEGETFPISDCEPDRQGIQQPQPDADLPYEVEGIVTLHPRYFLKVRVCNEDERFYGSFFLQDGKDGIVVLHDSRIADVNFGDRIRLKARALLHYFDIKAVLLSEVIEVVKRGVPIYYETKTQPFNESDWAKVRRISGSVVQPPTDYNFNEATVSDGINTWLVSIDRELANRNLRFEAGMKVQVTGPVLSNFGQKIIVLSLGQIEYLP